MSRNADLLIVAGLALLTLSLALLGLDNGALQVMLGLLLVLVLPGYAVSAAAFPDPRLGRVDRGLFVVGFSIGIAILSGFVLNWLSWGLQRSTWAALLAAITLGGCVVALVRRPARPVILSRPPLGLSLGQALLFSLAGLTVVGSILVARGEAAQRPAPDVVQLWIVPGDTAGSVRVGVITRGPVDEHYRLVLQRDGQTVREWPALTVRRNDRWEDGLTLPQQSSGRGPLEARLYRAEAPHQVFRQATLWLDQSAGGTASR